MFYIIALLCLPISIYATGWDIVDHKISKDESGIWKGQEKLPILVGLAVGSAAVIEGNQSRIGRTLWESVDSGILSYAIVQGGKAVFSRQRPSSTDDPNRWFEDGESMPSAHTALVGALVTPFILEYAEDTPWIHLLWTLPLYEGIGRLKAQEHWQSDVVVGLGIGIASAMAVRMYGPWSVRLMPMKGGTYSGFSYRW